VLEVWTESRIKHGRVIADVNQADGLSTFKQDLMKALHEPTIQEGCACRIRCTRCRQQEH